jgi:phosphatidylglycerol---prolipoprotein diacylglyceryl transferase
MALREACAVILYPNISPVIVSLGPVQLRWYGTMYLLGFLAAYWFLKRFTAKRSGSFEGERILDFLAYAALGIVVGGRLGYVLLYNIGYYIQHPLEVFALWHGGLSFHGGFIGVALTGWWFARRNGLSLYEIADAVVIPLPIGLGLGRIGNFINGELFGRPTEVPWCMVFPQGGPACRHPSQLYEALLEGVVLFLCMWGLGRTPRPTGVMLWSFVALYGTCRFLVEFTRMPDPQLGLLLGPLTMGQLLSAPMAILGGCMVWRKSGNPSVRSPKPEPSKNRDAPASGTRKSK